jgi:hypothetical protein
MPYVNRVEKFFVEATLLDLTNNDSTRISEFIKDINVKKAFYENSFPLVIINMMTTETFRDKMRDNDISINLKVTKYTDINQDNTEDAEQIVIDEVVFESTIKQYQKPFAATASRKEDEENTPGDSQRDTAKMIPYQFIGIPEDLINKNSIVVNEIYENAKIDDVLVHLLSQVETSRIFVDPSDNNEFEDSLIIPPLNLVPAIKYLNDVYGIYDTPLGLFFDFDGTYLFKLNNKTRTNRNSFEVIVTPADDVDQDLKYTSPQFDENGNIRLNVRVTPTFVSSEKINMDLMGQTAVFTSYDYNFDTTRRIYENETDNRKLRYFWNNYQNKLAEQQYLNSNFQTSEMTMINLSGISPTYFNIDTLYTIQSKDSYANGTFSLVEMTYSIYSNDFAHYNSVVSLKLNKIK